MSEDLSAPVVIERRRSRSWLDVPRRTVLFYMVLFVIAELVGAYVNIVAQAALDAIFAFMAINQAVFGRRTQKTTGVVMAALFTTRLMVITLPAADVSLPTRTAMVGAASCLVAYLATWVISHDIQKGRAQEGYSLKKPLISKTFTEIVTVLSAIPIGFAAYEILEPNPLFVNSLMSSTALPLVLAGAGLCIGALGEELVYRRLTAAMVQHAGQSQTPLISGILYSAAYMGTRNWAFVGLMFVVGSFFAWSCERTGSVRSVVAAHGLASLIVYLTLP
jgi:membrane protease YdiL (CAAX protease family)